MERYLDRGELRRRLGDCSASTVRRMVAAGELPPPRLISTGRLGWLESEVDGWMRSRPVGSLAARTAAATRAARREAA